MTLAGEHREFGMVGMGLGFGGAGMKGVGYGRRALNCIGFRSHKWTDLICVYLYAE